MTAGIAVTASVEAVKEKQSSRVVTGWDKNGSRVHAGLLLGVTNMEELPMGY